MTRPAVRDAEFDAIAQLLRQADFRFANLETTFAQESATPAAISGGTWAQSDPALLADLQAYGINLLGCATNHALDYGEQGVCDTLQVLRDAGVAHAGLGHNLHEASRPAFLETAAGRAALISLTSTHQDFAVAGAQRFDMVGRPGINPLRHSTTYRLPSEEIAHLQRIAQQTGINLREEMRISEGYALAGRGEGFAFGGHQFEASTGPAAVQTQFSAADMARTIRGIEEARASADHILVSIHCHEMRGKDKQVPPDFLVDFSRACIDAGAHAILGHGPHILRGIEVYRNRPIFYSLGNFIFQNETVQRLPSDFYDKYGLDAQCSVSHALDVRSDYGKKGLALNAKVWHSVIPQWEMQGGELQSLQLYPISLGFGQSRWQRGTPVRSTEPTPLQELQCLSSSFGTAVHIRDDATGYVAL